MEVYWVDRHGPSKSVEAKQKANARESKLSHPNVTVSVSGDAVFFQPTEYDLAGFSLKIEELLMLLDEMRRLHYQKRDPA